MALVTAYLAHNVRRNAGRVTVALARGSFGGLIGFLRAVRETLSEAQELRRALTHRFPFMDI
jgi:hypothetical protein